MEAVLEKIGEESGQILEASGCIQEGSIPSGLNASVDKIKNTSHIDNAVKTIERVDTPLVAEMGLETKYESSIDRPRETEASGQLNETATKIWEGLCDGNEAKERILREDLKEHPDLSKALNKNPELLKIFDNFIGSKYRTDLTALRYGANNADGFRQLYYKSPQNRSWIKGEYLRIEDKDGLSTIYNKNDGKMLGTLSGDVKSGYKIDLSKSEDPYALMDLSPLRNTEYTYKNMNWKTDGQGRPVEISVRLSDNTEVVSSRDNSFIGKICELKSGYNINTQDYRPRYKLKDDGGHLVADSWGGPSTSLNIVPQNANVNRVGLWRDSERIGLEAFKNGATVERTIKIEYNNRTSLRPSAFVLSQKIDGEYCVIKNHTVKELKIENIKEKKE